MKLVIFLAFISISHNIDNEFRISKNQDVNPTVAETCNNLTLKSNKPVEMLCIASCSSNQECVSVVYDRRSGLIQNCFLYNRYLNTSERIPSSTSYLYEKKQKTFFSVAGTPTFTPVTTTLSTNVSSVTSTPETSTFSLPSTDTTTFTPVTTTISTNVSSVTSTPETTYIPSATVLDSTVSSIVQTFSSEPINITTLETTTILSSTISTDTTIVSFVEITSEKITFSSVTTPIFSSSISTAYTSMSSITVSDSTVSTDVVQTSNGSFLELFLNGIDTQMFSNSNPAIQLCQNTATAIINNIQYNLVFDMAIGVHYYDSFWNYQSTFNINEIWFAIVVNNNFYFSTASGYQYGIIKTFTNSTSVLNFHGSAYTYRGLYYDATSSRIIAAGCEIHSVHTFDLDLNLINSVSLPGLFPYGVTVYGAKIYVALNYVASVAVISNSVIENIFSTKCSANLYRISVDSFGYFALSCWADSRVYLYDSNLEYTNKSLGFAGATDSRLDTNNRLAICGGNMVKIYQNEIQGTTDSSTSQSISVVISSTSIVQKSNDSFFPIFANPVDTSLFNNNPVIQGCVNVERAIINNVEYNLIFDNPVGVHLYDINWQYVSTFNFPGIHFGIVANDFYYFSLQSGSLYAIVKISLTSSIVLNSFGSVDNYRGIYYDASTSGIIAAGCMVNTVDFLDLNLNLVSSVSIGSCPHGITLYNSKVYVALIGNNNVAVISNGVIESFLTTQCSSGLIRVSVDSFGFFALSCGDGQAYLYDSNMQYASKTIGIAGGGICNTQLDTNGRLAMCGGTNVKIYINGISPVIQNTNGSFSSIFANPVDTLLFNNNPAIQGCSNIEKATINNIEYNLVIDSPVGVLLYDSNWNYQSTFNMPSINYAIVADGNFYITHGGNGCMIIRTTLTSPTVLNSYGGGYRGLHYDSVGSRIIAAGCDVSSVDVFDLDLNLLSSVSIGDCPHGVTVYNSKIYVAIYSSGNVAVISNGVIENTYSTICSGSLARISVDIFGYFALTCSRDGQVYLYDSNMQYTSKSVLFAYVNDARLDTNSRLAVCSGDTVIIYHNQIPVSTESSTQKLITTSPVVSSNSSVQNSNGSFFPIFASPIDTLMFNNNPAIQGCVNIERAKINNIKYNLIVDLPVGVHLYDSNWKYNSTFNMQNIHFGIVANDNYYYFTDGGNYYRIIKTTLTSPTILNSYGNGYRGLHYDLIDSRIIAAGCDVSSVDVFDLDLNLLSSVSIGGCPHGVTVYYSKIYVSLNDNGNVAVISNGVIENSYSTVCSSASYRISVDSFGYFSLSCGNGQAYLYDSIMQYTSKSIGIGVWVGNVKLDTNNRLVVCGEGIVKIYQTQIALGSFLSIFSNPTDTSLFNNNPAIQGCSNIEKTTINSIDYNLVIDAPVGVHFYDSNWKYNSTYNMPLTNYAIVANGYFYITDQGNSCRIIKTTLTSPTVLNFYGDGYRGLHYDSVGTRIIAAGCSVSTVDVLDLDLNLLSTVSFPGQCPHGVTIYNTKIYVALYANANIAVISNGVVENTYPTVCSGTFNRISVDSFGYFALSCYGDGQIYLYDSNIQYTNKSIEFGGVYDARLDTNNRLAICGGTSWGSIKIYN